MLDFSRQCSDLYINELDVVQVFGAMAWILFSVVLVAFSLQEASAIPLRDFYLYGADQGDEFLRSNDDESTRAISLTLPFHFFGRDHRTIFVSSNLKESVCY